MRAFVALGVLAALASILWLYFSTQAHTPGTLAYNYLSGFPGYLMGLAIVGGVLVLRAFVQSRSGQNRRTSSPHDPTNG